MHTAAIDYTVYNKALQLLIQNGWNINRHEVFAVIAEGALDWEGESHENVESLFTRLQRGIEQNHPTAIDLVYTGTQAGLSLCYVNPNELRLDLTDEVPKIPIADLPDYTWYLERLIPVFPLLHHPKVTCTYE
ncbi:hypothetical protein FLA_1152 [Filimonas lacunae]|nr:hypothetical protein FLA_1152 [Filimonas lacunae]